MNQENGREIDMVERKGRRQDKNDLPSSSTNLEYPKQAVVTRSSTTNTVSIVVTWSAQREREREAELIIIIIIEFNGEKHSYMPTNFGFGGIHCPLNKTGRGYMKTGREREVVLS